ncbi:MAG: internal scaffolding protein [Microvirus sp.]|nr:MAG: internal scaffolding protein [Microvirus sp.]
MMKIKPSNSPSESTLEVLRSFYAPHNRVAYDPHVINHATGELKIPERRVKQNHIAECDINNIMKQYSKTGQITHMSAKAAQGAYADLPDDLDFQVSMNIVAEGRTAFATLPAKVRDRFGNDPAQFLAFMADPDNQDEAIKMGLAKRRPEAATGGLVPPPPPTPPNTVAAPSEAPKPPKTGV